MKRRVLHIIDSLELSGGAEQQLAVNLKHFSDVRFDHQVAVLKKVPASRLDEVEGFAVVHHCPTPTWLGRLRWLRGILESQDISLIHATLTAATRSASLVGLVTGVPVIHSLVNVAYEPIRLEGHPFMRRWKLEVHRLIDRVLVRVPVRFQAISGRVASSWIENVGVDPTRVRVIPRGLPVVARDSEVRREWRRTMGFEDDHLVVLAVGRQEPQKRLWIALEAVAGLENPNVRLVLAGREGASTPRLRALIEGRGGGVVHEVGETSDVESCLQGSDVFIYPSLFEGLGVALLEAMATGLPVLTTDTPPLNEVVEDGESGLLCGVDEQSCWTRQLRRLTADPDLRVELGRSGQKVIAERFDIESVVRRLEALYSEAIDS